MGTFDRGLCDPWTLQRACAGLWRRTVWARGFICQQRPADKPVQEGLTSFPLLIQAGSFQMRLLPRFPLRMCVYVCLVARSCLALCDPWTGTHQPPPQVPWAVSSCSWSLQTMHPIVCPKPRGLIFLSFKLGDILEVT